MKPLLSTLALFLITATLWAASPVDINQASAEEIAAALNGVGLSKAEEIVRYREANGDFKHADELTHVKGIGMRTVDKNRDQILIQSTGSEDAD